MGVGKKVRIIDVSPTVEHEDPKDPEAKIARASAGWCQAVMIIEEEAGQEGGQ